MSRDCWPPCGQKTRSCALLRRLQSSRCCCDMGCFALLFFYCAAAYQAGPVIRHIKDERQQTPFDVLGHSDLRSKARSAALYGSVCTGRLVSLRWLLIPQVLRFSGHCPPSYYTHIFLALPRFGQKALRKIPFASAASLLQKQESRI